MTSRKDAVTACAVGRHRTASHGDVIPVLLAALGSAFDIPRPRHVGRDGWYTLEFASGRLAVTSHDPVSV
jgi:hypothetical protein